MKGLVPVFLIFVMICVQNCKSENFKLLILHNNDMHARFEETSERSGLCKEEDRKLQKCVGGFARVAHVIREARKAAEEGKGPNVLYLNAGDTYTGSPWFSIHKWKIVSDFLNTLHPDAMSFGNHEFDLGISGLTPLINTVKFPIVAANLDFSKELALESWNISKSVILNVGEHRIGVIGYITGETAQISAPGNIIFQDEISSVREESERLDAEGVKIIIALGHSGFFMDEKIAREVPLVDLVIGGHTNTFLWNGPAPSIEKIEGPYPKIVTQDSGKEVPVVQAYAYTKYMGHLNLEFDDDGNVLNVHGQPLLLNYTIPEDHSVLNLLNSYRPELDALVTQVVGKSRVVLDGDEKCRVRECSLGNFIADAFLDYHVSSYGGSYWTDAPIAIINGGAIRSVIEPKMEDGTFTRGELLSAMPFDDQIYSVSINGTDLLKTLENGARADGKTSRGEFLQVSGIKYKVDFSKPKYSRVSDVKVRCGLCKIPIYEPIIMHKSYRIITTGFLLSGGDGHVALHEKTYNSAQEDLNDIDMVARYAKLKSPIYPGEEERIIVDHIFLFNSDKSSGKKATYSFVLILSSFIYFNFLR